MAYQDLIILCLYFISGREEACSFENLVTECFDRFPDKFSFEVNRQWPDARKLDRALRELRTKGQIKGDPRANFRLTADGLKRGRQLSKLFRQEKLF